MNGSDSQAASAAIALEAAASAPIVSGRAALEDVAEEAAAASSGQCPKT